MIWLSIVSFIVVLGVLVLVHELGHFLVARLHKVAVEEFGFGFPPRLFGKRFGKTLYTINALPVGGFVKIKGIIDTSDAAVPTTPATDDFMGKSIWQRLSILLAGIVMNYLLTIVLLAATYLIGAPSYLSNIPDNAVIQHQAVLVADVSPDAPAALAGLVAGDTITHINGQSVDRVIQMKSLVNDSAPGSAILLTIDRSGQQIDLTTSAILLPDGSSGIGAYFVDTGEVQLPLIPAVREATIQTGHLTVELANALGGLVARLFQGQSVSAELSGPVGIATLTYQATNLGFVYVLQLAALLSLNLALFNLLPFPPLDGGKIIFVVVEGLIRRPVPTRWQVAIHNIGFILFLLFIMAVTIKDVIGLAS